MDWQTTSEDTVPSSVVTDRARRSMLGKPPATGAWREGDPVGGRRFVTIDDLALESGDVLTKPRIAYETFGERAADDSNVILLLHALTGDSHVIGDASAGHATAGWWTGIVGPGLAVDTDRWFVVAPNMLGGCQGSTGPASLDDSGREWGARFPHLTIRDQVEAQARFADALGIDRFAAVVGGSMGGMHALEWAVTFPDRVERLAALSTTSFTSADQIAQNIVQIEAIHMDPSFSGGDYYDAPDGDGPYRGLALARRMALLSYRSPDELNDRFGRSWQSELSPMVGQGRFAVASYLDFHGNKFTRRFDANSYITLARAMNSHDLGRDRGGVETALQRVTAKSLILGIDSDRLFPPDDQRRIAQSLRPSSRFAPDTDDHRAKTEASGAVMVASEFGHDGFLIENEYVGKYLRALLEA
ncbi:homoserine O-acetyltransferase MetX [Frondihabitans australicus]|uniref:Homoserine O-acetyltransferase n=1 Tax=Frondihabitans australicus TaxID=386892 RepID=A0A495ICL0_9MICO|nr:homoserine O-acetyltransferase [Frondihabitans australicus]RKR73744.1 homoserine O-acetyltransferase [Frondihabitans australicus]